MIRLSGDLVINPQLIESVVYAENGRLDRPSITITMASGAIHQVEEREAGSCKELYNLILLTSTAGHRSVNGPRTL